jgi:predicted NBD/HSP70 family sugar kinase
MALHGTNIEHARTWNRRVVLEAVRLHAPISRAEIARATGLTAQTVSNIVEELRRDGLLRHAGRRRSGRGQPPVDLVMEPNGGFTVGLHVAHRAIEGVLTNLAGETLAARSVPVRSPTPAEALPPMRSLVDDLAEEAGAERARLWGVGVVLPGPFGVEGPADDPAALPGWSDFPVADALGAVLGLPVFADNDATAAAIGERLYGAARSLRSFVHLYFGAGLGAGIFLDGHPWRGAAGNAGEIGHAVVDPAGPPCPCGGRGCLERYVSVQAACERLAAAGLPAAGPADLADALAAGSPAMLAWLDEAAARLRQALATLENLLDPEAVVVGGQLPEAVADALLRRMEPLPPTVARRTGRATPRLLRAAAGASTPALGAAALPIFAGTAPSIALLRKDAARAADAPPRDTTRPDDRPRRIPGAPA